MRDGRDWRRRSEKKRPRVDRRLEPAGVLFFEDLREGRTVGTEGGAGDLGELLARLHVLDHRLVEPCQVLVPVLRVGKGLRGARSATVLGDAAKGPRSDLGPRATRGSFRSRATTGSKDRYGGRSSPHRSCACRPGVHRARGRAHGARGSRDGRRRRVKAGSRPPSGFRAEGESSRRGRDLRWGAHLEHGLKAVRHTSHGDRMSLSSFDL